MQDALTRDELQDLRDLLETETRYVFSVDELPEEIGRARRRMERGQRPANLSEPTIRKWLKGRAC